MGHPNYDHNYALSTSNMVKWKINGVKAINTSSFSRWRLPNYDHNHSLSTSNGSSKFHSNSDTSLSTVKWKRNNVKAFDSLSSFTWIHPNYDSIYTISTSNESEVFQNNTGTSKKLIRSTKVIIDSGHLNNESDNDYVFCKVNNITHYVNPRGHKCYCSECVESENFKKFSENFLYAGLKSNSSIRLSLIQNDSKKYFEYFDNC